jgi:hypothetical protein
MLDIDALNHIQSLIQTKKSIEIEISKANTEKLSLHHDLTTPATC